MAGLARPLQDGDHVPREGHLVGGRRLRHAGNRQRRCQQAEQCGKRECASRVRSRLPCAAGRRRFRPASHMPYLTGPRASPAGLSRPEADSASQYIPRPASGKQLKLDRRGTGWSREAGTDTIGRGRRGEGGHERADTRCGGGAGGSRRTGGRGGRSAGKPGSGRADGVGRPGPAGGLELLGRHPAEPPGRVRGPGRAHPGGSGRAGAAPADRRRARDNRAAATEAGPAGLEGAGGNYNRFWTTPSAPRRRHRWWWTRRMGGCRR